MRRERVLITVKTYPTLSRSHIKWVCTAGLEWHDRAPNPWVIIGVVPFPRQRQLEFAFG